MELSLTSRPRAARLGFLGLCLASQGCFLDATVCTTEARFGLSVAVTDATTSLPVEGATVIARSGGFVEELRATTPGMFFGVHERPGFYELSVTANGYQPWSRGIVITKDECHVRLTNVEARLTHSP
jgi:hypothetical protein